MLELKHHLDNQTEAHMEYLQMKLVDLETENSKDKVNFANFVTFAGILLVQKEETFLCLRDLSNTARVGSDPKKLLDILCLLTLS